VSEEILGVEKVMALDRLRKQKEVGFSPV